MAIPPKIVPTEGDLMIVAIIEKEFDATIEDFPGKVEFEKSFTVKNLLDKIDPEEKKKVSVDRVIFELRRRYLAVGWRDMREVKGSGRFTLTLLA